MRISSHVIGQKRVSGRAVDRSDRCNMIPRPAAWIATVMATRHEAIKSFAIIRMLVVVQVLAVLKIFDCIQ
jgi:hypothetical protein